MHALMIIQGAQDPHEIDRGILNHIGIQRTLKATACFHSSTMFFKVLDYESGESEVLHGESGSLEITKDTTGTEDRARSLH